MEWLRPAAITGDLPSPPPELDSGRFGAYLS